MNKYQKLIEENNQLKSTLDNLIINFNKLTQKIVHSSDVDDTLDVLFDLCFEIFHYEEIAVYMMEKEYELKRFRNLPEESYMEISDIQEEDIFDWCILQNKQVMLPRKYKSGCYVLLPLTIRNKSLGIMLLGTDRDKNEITREIQDLLNMVAAQVSVAIENSLLYSSLEDQNKKLDNIKNYMKNIIENFNEGLIVLDNDFIITTINEAAEKYLGMNRKEILLKNIKNFMNNWLTLDFFEKIDKAVKNLDISTYIVDVNEKFLKFTIIPFKGLYKNILGSIIHIEDITTSMELKKLKEIDDFKEQVLSNVSHELKTPLTSIKAYAQTMVDMMSEEKIEDKNEYIDFLNIIDEESDRLLRLIVEILDTSKLDSGQVDLNREDMDIYIIIRKICAGLEELLKPKKLKFEYKVNNQEEYIINADKIKIEQVFYNLFSNAIKYNVDNGKIIIDIAKNQKDMKITIQDTGVGIEKNNIEKIFNKFFRENTEKTKEESGFGLGLNIVKNIIDLHNGRIKYYSDKGKGTKVNIWLPYE